MTQIGELSDVLRLTFKEVGVTPDNAYWIWVSKDQNLIKQWAYFKHFLIHYLNLYHHGMTIGYGEILLATGRGWRNLTKWRFYHRCPLNFISL